MERTADEEEQIRQALEDVEAAHSELMGIPVDEDNLVRIAAASEELSSAIDDAQSLISHIDNEGYSE
ncbi:hypothetical protein H9L19_06745 [Weissella diestrammenae]|uniref:Uncharacterized protein n=1 Tax=Weissella diestrammenae TaxID=1162633 RepID=A0A7G9T4P4_9LACO|nr:hypothetical protein [Weissella diestrammenae]MCM0582776.1 hypothetical protein [Weissella diestrammenae]QNN75069.1 hypothetical protein H9L19_06745 [Weissella diestrammenae]